MPNTIKPTAAQAISEGPLAVVPEVDDILALADVTIDPLTAGLPAGESFGLPNPCTQELIYRYS